MNCGEIKRSDNNFKKMRSWCKTLRFHFWFQSSSSAFFRVERNSTLNPGKCSLACWFRLYWEHQCRHPHTSKNEIPAPGELWGGQRHWLRQFLKGALCTYFVDAGTVLHLQLRGAEPVVILHPKRDRKWQSAGHQTAGIFISKLPRSGNMDEVACMTPHSH